jgi:hypothetical protein
MRRQYLLYCRKHRGHVSEETSEPTQNGAPMLDQVKETSHAGLEEPNSVLKPSKLPLTTSTIPSLQIEGRDEGFEEGGSFSTLATSLCGEPDDVNLRVPDLQDVATPGEPFQCPYCQTAHCFNGQAAWE